MVVGRDGVRVRPWASSRVNMTRRCWRPGLVIPVFQQVTMPSRMAGSLSISSNKASPVLQVVGAGAISSCGRQTAPPPGGTIRNINGKARALAGDGAHIQPVLQRAPAGGRWPAQAHAFVAHAAVLGQAHELAKDGGQFFWLDLRPDPTPLRARRRRCVGSPAAGCHGGCSGWRWTKSCAAPAQQHPEVATCTTAAQLCASAGCLSECLGQRANSGGQLVQQRRHRKVVLSVSTAPASSREISSRVLIRSSTASSAAPALSARRAALAAAVGGQRGQNSRAAFSGCKRSWLAAAKAGLLRWASSAAWMASAGGCWRG